MKGVLCLFSVILLVNAAISARIYHPEEDDINYKRHMLVKGANAEPHAVEVQDAEGTVQAQPLHMTYYIYTKKNPDDPFIVAGNDANEFAKSPTFDPAKDNVVIIHGWVDSYTADVNRLVKAALLKKVDVNIIVVDWSPIAAESYTTAQGSVTSIGEFVGTLINDLQSKYGLDGSKFLLIGHSLGAHIAGNAGSVIKKKVAHIIGLDPAAPLFTVANTENRLDPSDADYVQIIHTNGRFLGFSTSIGHADFYPNGGMIQAGCGLDLGGGCSHARAYQYLAESIENDGKFTGTLCPSVDNFDQGLCSGNKKASMGKIKADKSVVGDFFLNTKTAAPFAIN